MKPIRVLIVEDSAVVREHLRRIISSDARMEVAGLASSGEEALEMVNRLSPDVISMDIQLPGIQGFEATRRIMAVRPTPIVVVSGIEMEQMNLTMEALKAGALAVVEKPVAATHEQYQMVARRLCTQLAIMSEVKVVRRREITSVRRPEFRFPLSSRITAQGRVLGIAASTGGPNALSQLLSGLGNSFPLPIAIVQHMTPGFMNGFADWLASVTPFSVSVVDGPTTMVGGRVYLAPSDRHLILNGMSAMLDDSPPAGNHRPSANHLFVSIARSFGPAGIGVLLTGMGEDGALGLRELKVAGGFTVAEAESTAVVYGMPAAAVRLGGASESLPLLDIAPRILDLISVRTEAV